MLVVFDLDFTIWDCGGVWCDCTNPPYKKMNGYLIDSSDRLIALYPDVKKLLSYLQNKDIEMALASRTSEPEWANDMLEKFGIEHHFPIKEIYPSSKTVHFGRLAEQTDIDFQDMFFFDDEYRNIDEISRMGVNCFHVKEGITFHSVLNFIQNGH